MQREHRKEGLPHRLRVLVPPARVGDQVVPKLRGILRAPADSEVLEGAEGNKGGNIVLWGKGRGGGIEG